MRGLICLRFFRCVLCCLCNCNRCRERPLLRRITAPGDGEELVKRVGKKLNGRYALVSIFSARAKIRLVVRLLPFARLLLLALT